MSRSQGTVGEGGACWVRWEREGWKREGLAGSGGRGRGLLGAVGEGGACWVRWEREGLAGYGGRGRGLLGTWEREGLSGSGGRGRGLLGTWKREGLAGCWVRWKREGLAGSGGRGRGLLGVVGEGGACWVQWEREGLATDSLALSTCDSAHSRQCTVSAASAKHTQSPYISTPPPHTALNPYPCRGMQECCLSVSIAKILFVSLISVDRHHVS